MIDPKVRAADLADATDLAQLVLLETEARTALVGQRGGHRWLAENPPVSPDWALANATYDNGRRYVDP